MDPDPDCPVDVRGGRCQTPRETGIGTAWADSRGGSRKRCERRDAAEATVAVECLRTRNLSPAARKQVGAQPATVRADRPGGKHRLNQVSPRVVAGLSPVRRVRVASLRCREIPVLRGKQRTVARAGSGGQEHEEQDRQPPHQHVVPSAPCSRRTRPSRALAGPGRALRLRAAGLAHRPRRRERRPTHAGPSGSSARRRLRPA